MSEYYCFIWSHIYIALRVYVCVLVCACFSAVLHLLGCAGAPSGHTVLARVLVRYLCGSADVTHACVVELCLLCALQF